MTKLGLILDVNDSNFNQVIDTFVRRIHLMREMSLLVIKGELADEVIRRCQIISRTITDLQLPTVVYLNTVFDSLIDTTSFNWFRDNPSVKITIEIDPSLLTKSGLRHNVKELRSNLRKLSNDVTITSSCIDHYTDLIWQGLFFEIPIALAFDMKSDIDKSIVAYELFGRKIMDLQHDMIVRKASPVVDKVIYVDCATAIFDVHPFQQPWQYGVCNQHKASLLNMYLEKTCGDPSSKFPGGSCNGELQPPM